MLRIDRAKKQLTRLSQSSLTESAHWERHIQEMICTSPDPFCEEIGEKLWIVGQEVRPSDAIQDRIDILAIDEEGCGVVIELKRGSHKLQLLQAISYAGMIARWPQDRFVETLAQDYKQSLEDALADIEDHIGSELATVNQSQRIILIAEDFDPALLVGAEWLHEHFSVDIRCYRMVISQEDGHDYLTCACIYPPLEIASLTRGKEPKTEGAGEIWTDWDTALQGLENQAIVEFFRKELAQPHEARLRNRELVYRVGGKRRFYVSCQKKYAYVWQEGRFVNDLEFWAQKLSDASSIVQVWKNHSRLRFHLVSSADFNEFAKAAHGELQNVQFSEPEDFAGPQTEE